MKILYHHRTRSKDGQNVHIDELTRALRARGHEIVMVAPAAMDTEEFGADAGAVAMMKKWIPKAVYELMELAYAGFAYLRLRKAYLKHRPDILYERYNLFLPSGVWLKRRFGLPMLSEVNAPISRERAEFDGLALSSLARWSERMVWRGADYVLPVTGVLGSLVRSAGVPEDRIVVIPNGINPERFGGQIDREAAKARLGLEGRLVLGFTGFMRPWHGLDRVVDFIGDSDPAARLHFLAVGDGPVRADLEAQIAARDLTDRITFSGLVGREEIASYVAAFDIALQPDVVAYASPLKLFEYMACACAIVAPDSDNIREILTDGTDALLFHPGDTSDFCSALHRLCTDPDLRLSIGAAAARTIDEKGLTWDANAERVERLCRKLIDKAASSAP